MTTPSEKAERATCKGYIATSKFGLIYYTDGKNVYRATPSTVADCASGYLQGRWECTVAHWNHFCQSVYEMPAIKAGDQA